MTCIVLSRRPAVSAYCTHGVFPNQAWKRFSPEENGGCTTSKHVTAVQLHCTRPFVHGSMCSYLLLPLLVL